MPRLYTARPLHIEAVQFLGVEVNGEECREFLGDDFDALHAFPDEIAFVARFGGSERALVNDWLVRHPSGWFQAVPNDVFLVTYTEV